MSVLAKPRLPELLMVRSRVKDAATPAAAASAGAPSSEGAPSADGGSSAAASSSAACTQLPLPASPPPPQPPSTPRRRADEARRKEEEAQELASRAEAQLTARSTGADLESGGGGAGGAGRSGRSGRAGSATRRRIDYTSYKEQQARGWDGLASRDDDEEGAEDFNEVPSRYVHVHDVRPQVVFVSRVHNLQEASAEKSARFERALRTRYDVCAAMRQAGLHLRTHLSKDGTRQFVCVSASEARLLREAERVGMEMRLGPEYRTPPLRKKRGVWQFEPDYQQPSDTRHCAAYADFSLRDIDRFEPFDALEGLFFRPLERQRLIYSVMAAAPEQGGAGIDLSSLMSGGSWRWDDSRNRISSPEPQAALFEEKPGLSRTLSQKSAKALHKAEAAARAAGMGAKSTFHIADRGRGREVATVGTPRA